MKSNKILVGLVIALILVNCVLLGFFWLRAYPTVKADALIMRAPAFDYLTKELKLTPEQKKQYEKMRDTHFQLTDSLNTQTRMLRDSFFDKLKDPAIKPAVINALGQKIGANTVRLDTSTFYHFARFRAILDSNQKHRFDQIIQNVLHSMAGPGPGGPGRGMQGPPPGGQGEHNRFLPGGRHGRGLPPGRRPGDKHFEGPPGKGRPPGFPPGGPPPDGPPPGGGPPPDRPPPGGPPNQQNK
jgi:hypothetical protein